MNMNAKILSKIIKYVEIIRNFKRIDSSLINPFEHKRREMHNELISFLKEINPEYTVDEIKKFINEVVEDYFDYQEN